MDMDTPVSADRIALTLTVHLSPDEYDAIAAYGDLAGYQQLDAALLFTFYRGLIELERDPQLRTCVAPATDEREGA